MQTSKNGEQKKDHAIRYQIKILTCSQAKKDLKKKKMLSCYQTQGRLDVFGGLRRKLIILF